MKGKKRANPKRADGSNIPSDKTPPINLTRLLDRGKSFLNQEDGEKALIHLRRLQGRSLSHPLCAEFHDYIGQAYQLCGEFKFSHDHFSSSLKYYQKLGDRWGCLQCFLKLGDVSRQLERYDLAVRWYRRALSESKRFRTSVSGPYLSSSDDALCGLALSYRGLGKFKPARSKLSALVSLYHKKRDPVGEAFARWALGTTQRFMGNLRQSHAHLERSLRIYQTSKDRGGEAYSLCGLGGTLRMRGLATESGRLYKRAFHIFKRVGDSFGMAYSYCGQGNAARMRADFKRSDRFFQSASSIYRRLGQKGPLGFVLWSQAQTKIYQGHLVLARKMLARSEKLFRSVKDERGLVYSQLGWGEFMKKKGHPGQRAYFMRAIKMSRHRGLRLEETHARRALGSQFNWNQYRRLGVDIKNMKRYKTLP